MSAVLPISAYLRWHLGLPPGLPCATHVLRFAAVTCIHLKHETAPGQCDLQEGGGLAEACCSISSVCMIGHR